MTRHILLINAHPDPSPSRLAAALADAYQQGAERAGHVVRRIDLGDVSFPPVVTGYELEAAPPDAIREAQEAISWAQHIVIVFPVWIGGPPALLKSYFEQITRYGFALDHRSRPLLKGRSVRLIFTTLMPAIIYRLLLGTGVKGFARGALWASGLKPIRTLALGNVMTADKKPWFTKLKALGARAK